MYCKRCGGEGHYDGQCVSTKRSVSTKLTQPVSTKPVSTKGMKSSASRVKKWRTNHREEFNRQRRERYASQKLKPK